MLSAHVHAAVDVEGVAGDVAGVFGGEEGDGVGDVEVGSGAAERDVLGHGGLLVVGEDGGHGRLDVSGGDCIDRDGAAGELPREGFGEADEAGFGGGVVGLAGLTGFADDRGDVDDAAPAVFDHLGHDGLGKEKGPGEVGGEDVVPVLALHAEGEDVAGDAGVVDEDVNAAEVDNDRFGTLFDGVFAGDVEREGVGGASGCGDLSGYFGELVGVPGGERDGGSGGGEAEGAGAANSLGSSCNECDTTS